MFTLTIDDKVWKGSTSRVGNHQENLSKYRKEQIYQIKKLAFLVVTVL